MREKLTDRLAKTLVPGLYWDEHPDAPRGFLLQVTSGGGRAYRLNYRRQSDGVERRCTIGDVSTWPIKLARERANELRRIVDEGGDPLGEAQEKRAAPTVAELADRFIAEVLPRRAPSTQRDYREQIRDWILPAIGRHKVAAVTRDEVERLHRKVTAEGKLRRANAVLGTVHQLFEHAIRWKMRDDNPAKRIQRNPEHNRERYLSEAEIERLLATLDRWQQRCPDSVAIIRLLMLTGARRGEVVGMEWSQLDLDAGVWSKPASSTKQRKPHRVPLSPQAIELLRQRRASHVVRLHDDRVFPNDSTVHRLERDWREARAAAGLEDCRMHDLRHSFASMLVAQNLSLPIVGALLGHSKPATTARYAHLADQPLREAAAIVGKIVGGGKGSAK